MSQIILDMKPVGLNQAYSTNRQGRRFLVARGKTYKALVGMKAIQSMREFEGYLGPLKFEYVIEGPWLTKSGSISKTAGDIDGFSKLLCDAVCEALGINDCTIFEVVGRKVVAGKWRIIATLYQL